MRQDLDDQVVTSGDVITLANRIDSLDEGEELLVFLAFTHHKSEHHDVVAKSARIDIHPIAADDAFVLKASDLTVLMKARNCLYFSPSHTIRVNTMTS